MACYAVAQMHSRLELGFLHVFSRFTEPLFRRCGYECTWITSHHTDCNNFAQLSSISVIYLDVGEGCRQQTHQFKPRSLEISLHGQCGNRPTHSAGLSWGCPQTTCHSGDCACAINDTREVTGPTTADVT